MVRVVGLCGIEPQQRSVRARSAEHLETFCLASFPVKVLTFDSSRSTIFFSTTRFHLINLFLIFQFLLLLGITFIIIIIYISCLITLPATYTCSTSSPGSLRQCRSCSVLMYYIIFSIHRPHMVICGNRCTLYTS